MKIACVILGTRGDVQPMVALAVGLMERGHEVVLCAPPEHGQWVSRYGCPFVPFGPEIRKSIREKPEKQRGGVAVNISPKQGKQIVLDQISRLPSLLKGVDLVLGAGIVVGVKTAADILQVPYRLVAFYPVILGTTPSDPRKNRMMFGFGRKMMNLMMKGYLNKARAAAGLTPVRDIWEHWMGEEVILACDREISPGREQVAFPFIQTGFMLLPSRTEIPPETEAFLSSGTPPVYIGFGSNPITNADTYIRMFERVQETTGQRLIISKGWAEFPGISSGDILYVDELPFERLFPRLAAAVYHGGTGTLAALARAGIPQAAFPFMGDQFDNRKQIVRLGLGPATCDFKEISAEAVSASVTECVSNVLYRNNARDLAEKLKDSDGTALTVRYIEERFIR